MKCLIVKENRAYIDQGLTDLFFDKGWRIFKQQDKIGLEDLRDLESAGIFLLDKVSFDAEVYDENYI